MSTLVRSTLIVFSIYLFSLNAFSAQKKNLSKELVNPHKIGELSKKQGYLLVDVEVSGVAPSFNYIKLGEFETRHSPVKKSKKSKRKPKTVDLKATPNGLYAMILPQGLYQITGVNAPFFDLPYKLDTSTRSEWRFAIEAGKTNYIGKLSIKKERSTRFIDVNLLNRFATEKSRLDREIEKLLVIAPLSHGVGFRDDYSDELAKTQETSL